MARFRDEQKVIDAFAPHLPPGETVRYYGYGVKQPPIILIFFLFLLAILPGAIAVALLTKEYLVALTEKRFLVLRFSGGKIDVKEVLEYPLDGLAHVKTSKGGLFTHLRIDDPQKPFVAKFHRLGLKQNKPHCEAIADALEQAARGQASAA